MASLGLLTVPLNLVPPLRLGGATWGLYRGSLPLSSDVVILRIFNSKLSILLIILPMDFGVCHAPSSHKCCASGSHIPTSFSGCHCIWDMLNGASAFSPVPSVSNTLFITGFSTSVIKVSLISLNMFTLITCVTSTGGSIALIAITCASSGYPNLFAKFFTSLQKSSISSFVGSNFQVLPFHVQSLWGSTF